MILRARLVYPVSGPPISGGAVVVSGSAIKSVGPWKELRGPRKQVMDLGDTAILPGLINAHCHLDYTHMAGQIPPPKVFTDWLKTITELKAGWDLSDYQTSWVAGAHMLVKSGTTTVADIEAFPELLPEMWHSTPLRVFSFLEMIGITERRPAAQLLDQAIRKIRALPGGSRGAGLSPHAPYSTLPSLLRLTSETSRQHGLRVCIHLAESALEFAMFRHGKGAMFEWLERSSRDMSDCGLGSPVKHLQRCGLLGSRVLAAHVNYLARGDASLLGNSGTHVVHCPRSHHYFMHGRFRLKTLRRAGVNICLGTDSLASVYRRRNQQVELSMFDEMRALADAKHGVRPETILEMATVNGARALGLSWKIGELRAGASADLILLPYHGAAGQLPEFAVHHHGHVSGSMIRGQWVLTPGCHESHPSNSARETAPPALPGPRRTPPELGA